MTVYWKVLTSELDVTLVSLTFGEKNPPPLTTSLIFWPSSHHSAVLKITRHIKQYCIFIILFLGLNTFYHFILNLCNGSYLLKFMFPYDTACTANDSNLYNPLLHINNQFFKNTRWFRANKMAVKW